MSALHAGAGRWLLLSLAIWLGGCAAPGGLGEPGASGTPGAGIEVGTRQALDSPALLARMARADIVLLGEWHDVPAHHAQRGAWLVQLAGLPGQRPVVVAEHLGRGLQVDAARAGQALLPALEAAGFDARGWAWPAHQALFEPLLRAGLPLWGGNLPRDEARRIAREAEAAWPADLSALLQRAPLTPQAQDTLDAALRDSHCGMLSAQRVPAMRAAQRARDAAMAQALLQAHAQGARPAVLVAGNGHVRRDHGVAQLLAALAPQLRVLSVTLVEGPPDGPADAATDLVWTTPAAPGQAGRQDPCAAMKAAVPAPAQAAGVAP